LRNRASFGARNHGNLANQQELPLIVPSPANSLRHAMIRRAWHGDLPHGFQVYVPRIEILTPSRCLRCPVREASRWVRRSVRSRRTQTERTPAALRRLLTDGCRTNEVSSPPGGCARLTIQEEAPATYSARPCAFGPCVAALPKGSSFSATGRQFPRRRCCLSR
jgi:hypothetical protein